MALSKSGKLFFTSARITNCGHSNIEDLAVCQNDMLLPYGGNELNDNSGCSKYGGLKVK